jgi:peptidoglycan-associated lipoprotein
MRRTTVGWILGSLGLFAAAGTARGNEDEGASDMATGAATPSSSKPECKDAGVTVAFKVDSDELDQNARGGLDGVATWLKADERRTLFLEGFADTTGQAESNLVLSAKRAAAVKDYLLAHGVEGSRVATVGRGEEVDHLPANGRAVTFLACQSAVPGPAVAQLETPPVKPVEPVESEEQSQTAATMPAPPAPRGSWASRFGWAVMAGGNYTDFTNNNMRDVTGGGGGWDARFIGGTHSFIGFEAAYIGAANSINNLGVNTANNPRLVQNGLEGTGRLNIPIRMGASLFEPYGYAGLGYSRFHVSNFNSNTGTLSSFNGTDDNTMTFPVGGGFAYAYKAFIADVRAGWTGVYYDNLMSTTVSNNGALNHWNAGGQIGFMF